MNVKRVLLKGWLVPFVICCLPGLAIAQDSATILTGVELNRVVPPGFYFHGLWVQIPTRLPYLSHTVSTIVPSPYRTEPAAQTRGCA